MATLAITDSTVICENVLRTTRERYAEHKILPSEIAIIDRLLARSLELTGAYQEVYDKLHERSHGISECLGVVTNTAAFWNPDRTSTARDKRQRLEAVNARIALVGHELASLLRERSELHNTSGFSSDTHYHIARVVEETSAGNHYFSSYLKQPLAQLRSQFDLKYWPDLEDIIETLAKDAQRAQPEATDMLTATATAASRGSRADFFKTLLVAIDDRATGRYADFPIGFSLSDSAIASLGTCALDLGPDEIVDAQYVKRLRQRARESVSLRPTGRRP